MQGLRIDNLTIEYRGGHIAVSDLTLKFPQDKISLILGAIGSGKSSILKAIAGLISYEGSIYFEDSDVLATKIKHRDFTYAAFDMPLFDNKSVEYNLGYGLRLRKTDNDIINARTLQACARFDLTNLLKVKVKRLSYYQRRRLIFARAFMRTARLYLLGDPLIGLDQDECADLTDRLAKALAEAGSTVLITASDFQSIKTLIGKTSAVLSDSTKTQAILSDTTKTQALLSDSTKTQAILSDSTKTQAILSDSTKTQAILNDSTKTQAMLIRGGKAHCQFDIAKEDKPLIPHDLYTALFTAEHAFYALNATVIKNNKGELTNKVAIYRHNSISPNNDHNNAHHDSDCHDSNCHDSNCHDSDCQNSNYNDSNCHDSDCHDSNRHDGEPCHIIYLSDYQKLHHSLDLTDNIIVGLSSKHISTAKQEAIDNKQEAINNKQEAIDNRQETINSKQEAIDNKQEAIDNKLETIDSKQETINNKQETIDGKQELLTKLMNDEILINELHIFDAQSQKLIAIYKKA